MVSLSNHEGGARAVVRRFMVRPAKRETFVPVLTMKRIPGFWLALGTSTTSKHWRSSEVRACGCSRNREVARTAIGICLTGTPPMGNNRWLLLLIQANRGDRQRPGRAPEIAMRGSPATGVRGEYRDDHFPVGEEAARRARLSLPSPDGDGEIVP
jgi:hypothetical protein